MEHLNQVILGSGTYFPPVNALSKQKRAMRHRMSKTCELKVTCYDAFIIDINEYLGSFPGSNKSDKIGET